MENSKARLCGRTKAITQYASVLKLVDNIDLKSLAK
jgi:hypothetical protein